MKTISSQRYLDDEIVATKSAAQNYAVLVSPEFEIDGEAYRVILDGHHALAAAIQDGVEPDYTTATGQECDSLQILADDPDNFLRLHYMDSDYYDVATGSPIW
jgi:hypothetical protein